MKKGWVALLSLLGAQLGSQMLATPALAHNGDGTQPIEFKSVELTPQITMLQGTGGNVGVLNGPDGLFVIDDDYKENSDALMTAFAKINSEPARFVVNTHWHNDHTGGNERVGAESTIVAHSNVRKRLSSPQSVQLFNMTFAPSSAQALPIITYDESIQFHLNGQTIRAEHFPNGHTDTDTIVFFQPANVVHMGDHFFSGMFPFIDVENGGDVVKYAANVAEVMTRVDGQTKIMPGHGPLSDLDDLKRFHNMILETTEMVRGYIQQGLTLEQAKQKGLPAKWGNWGKGFINQATWVHIIYSSLKAPK